jgi:hypothetical protein
MFQKTGVVAPEGATWDPKENSDRVELVPMLERQVTGGAKIEHEVRAGPFWRPAAPRSLRKSGPSPRGHVPKINSRIARNNEKGAFACWQRECAFCCQRAMREAAGHTTLALRGLSCVTNDGGGHTMQGPSVKRRNPASSSVDTRLLIRVVLFSQAPSPFTISNGHSQTVTLTRSPLTVRIGIRHGRLTCHRAEDAGRAPPPGTVFRSTDYEPAKSRTAGAQRFARWRF